MRPGFGQYRNAPDVMGLIRPKREYKDRDVHLISNTNIFNERSASSIGSIERFNTEAMRQFNASHALNGMTTSKKQMPPAGVLRSISV